MVKEVNHACEKLNEKLGISVSLPNLKKKTLKAASVCNFAVGVGLVVAGVVFPVSYTHLTLPTTSRV